MRAWAAFVASYALAPRDLAASVLDSQTPRKRPAGIWRGPGDPVTMAAVILVDGYLLGGCVSLNIEAKQVDVDLWAPETSGLLGEKHKWRPHLVICDDEYVSQRLDLGDALEIYFDGKGYPNKGFRYWTGSGWIDDESKSIPGPTPRIIPRVIAEKTIPAGAKIVVRNGRAWPTT